MKGDIFKNIAQAEYSILDRKTKKPFNFRLPCFYYDDFIFIAFYSASTKLVQPYLPDRRMHPLEVKPGRCVVSLAAIEHRSTDINPYNEFVMTYMISFGKRVFPMFSLMSQKFRREFELYAPHLPVTTDIALQGGIDLYGFPKILAGIDFTRTSSSVKCSITEKKKHILTLEGPVLPTAGKGHGSYKKFYPVYNGITIRGDVIDYYSEYAETRNTEKVKLSIGNDHPICSELKAIDLSDKAFAYHYVPSCESILFGPRNLAECRS